MVDLLAALKAAKLKASVFAGNGGSTGNGSEKARFHNDLKEPRPVATTQTAVATLATLQGDVAIVATGDMAMATRDGHKNTKQIQHVNTNVATVASVATEKQHVCENQRTNSARHADLLNSLTFYEPQADPNRCHVCGERETVQALFIAVLSAKPDHPHWLHVGCHDEHIRRCVERRQS